MTQKEVRKQLNSLWVEVNTLENKMGYLPPVVDPNQEQWVTEIEEQITEVKSRIDSMMKLLEV